MLLELIIENFAIIEKCRLTFENNFNIITGETGAGKSLLIDALRFLKTTRANNSYIRANTDTANITAIFRYAQDSELSKILEEYSIPQDDDIIILRKTLSKKNGQRSFVNDTFVTAATLKTIADILIEMHGQLENQALLFPKYQLRYLDLFAKNFKLLDDYKTDFEKVNTITREITELKKIANISQSEIDWKKFQLQELSTIKITEVEYNELLNKIKLLEKSQALNKQFNNIISIFENAEIEIDKFENEFNIISQMPQDLIDINNQLKQIKSEITVVNDDIKNYLEKLENNIDNIDDLQAQLYNIQKIFRKYKLPNFQALKDLRDKLEAELNNVIKAEDKIKELNELLTVAQDKLFDSAKKLSNMRIKTATKIEKLVTTKIKSLSMPDAEFKIYIQFDNSNYSETGADIIEFRIKANKGAEFLKLADTASGGELSRIMLALKTINAESVDCDTIIFDEIDTGISGNVAAKIAAELYNISRDRQVMCITHQPAIAAITGKHFKIEKITATNKVNIKIIELTRQQKIEEIANLMTGGKITQTSLKSAEELVAEFENKSTKTK